ncbi:MAG: UDP-3-O-(3-hydroxymyristoyl)glucosamine N-acyltransferase [Candidatus Omnitrophica bacterium]|nr:UDP-3-O-(3-hydroxymyristoyl)glucosamine N-acyltransferase [Candidatus Omnitrophota bacterium]
MQKSLKEIAKIIGGEVVGDDSVVITGASGIKEACKGEITFVANPKYFSLIEKTQASAIVAPLEIENSSKPIIRIENPSLAFTKIISSFMPNGVIHPKGIHSRAVIGKDVALGKNVAIGPYAVIEDNVAIGENSIIYSGCYIGHHTKIGSDSLIYSNVSIREYTAIGKRVIIHSGTVIGSDGFGFATIKGGHHKIPQVGIVEIGDDVEIGANVTIDRARFDKTVIGRGCKIDNLVQIAHNVAIGENCIIVAQVGISGSTTLGKNVTLAGQAGLVGHITVGDEAVVGAQGGVTKSIPPKTFVSGYPARPHDEAMRVHACTKHLPKLFETVKKLEKKIAELEEKLKIK